MSIIQDYVRDLLLDGTLPVIFFILDVLGLVVLLVPGLPVNSNVGLAIVLVGFFAGNLVLYRKLKPDISDRSLLIEPYPRMPYNGAQIRFVGNEPINDLHVQLSFISADGKEQHQSVEQFFPERDAQLSGHSPLVSSLVFNEIHRFHLPNYEETQDGKVAVKVSFRVVRTGKQFVAEKLVALKHFPPERLVY